MANVLITADRYNQLQRRISAILGDSTSSSLTTGWGQDVYSDTHYPITGGAESGQLVTSGSFISGQVYIIHSLGSTSQSAWNTIAGTSNIVYSVGSLFTAQSLGVGTGQAYEIITNSTIDIISAQEYKDLYIDIVRSRVHQVGAANFVIDPFVVGNYQVNSTNTDLVENAYITDLESLVTSIETDKFQLHSTQSTIIDYAVNQRSTGWNQQLIHEFSLTFPSDLARRHFFNAGGEIRISAELTGDASQKGTDWSTLLDFGIISINHNTTVNSKGLSTQSYGNYTLPSTFTTIFTKTAATYTGNLYKLEARSASSTQLQFKATFLDANASAVNPADAADGFPDVDEPVLGTIKSFAQVLKPFGTVTIDSVAYDTVKIAEPTYIVITNLTAGS